MKKILIDTNIVLDLLAKREPYYLDSAKIFSMADKLELKIFISSLTIAIANYILSKYTNSVEARNILRKFKLLVEVLPLDDKIIGLALVDDEFSDFEDGIQYFTAFESNLDSIVTRNLKDFRKSKLPVFTPEQFLSSLRTNF